MLISLFLAIIIVERSGKLSEIKSMTSPALLASSRNERNLKGHFAFKFIVNFRGKPLKIQCTFNFTQDPKRKSK